MEAKQEEKRVIPTAGVLILEEGKVLLVCHMGAAKHHTGTYGLPAGKLEEGESETQAAVRELEEETGLKTRESYLIPLPTLYGATIALKDSTETFTFRVFLCQRYDGEIRGPQGDGVTAETQPEWVCFDALEKLNLLPDIPKMIGEGLNIQSQGVLWTGRS